MVDDGGPSMQPRRSSAGAARERAERIAAVVDHCTQACALAETLDERFLTYLLEMARATAKDLASRTG